MGGADQKVHAHDNYHVNYGLCDNSFLHLLPVYLLFTISEPQLDCIEVADDNFLLVWVMLVWKTLSILTRMFYAQANIPLGQYPVQFSEIKSYKLAAL